LALFYLREGRREEAKKIFDDLANLSDDERELRAFGLAGQSVVLSYEGNKYNESMKIIDEFLPNYYNYLNNTQMERYVQEAIKRNQSKPEAATTEKH
jgi:hypothetical protein